MITPFGMDVFNPHLADFRNVFRCEQYLYGKGVLSVFSIIIRTSLVDVQISLLRNIPMIKLSSKLIKLFSVFQINNNK